MKNNLALISIFSIVCMFGISVAVRADTFVVILDVNGFYNGGVSDQVDFEFDLGTALTEVESARFICEGNITAGLDYWGEPISVQFEAKLLTGIDYMFARSPYAGADTWPEPEPFSCNSLFTPAHETTWDFLLDGHTEACVLLNGPVGPISFPPQENSSGTITSASFIIEATPVCEADINGDGKVNQVDFAILAAQWRQAPGQPSADIAPSGGDGIVDILDLALLCDCWLEGTTP